VTKNEVHTKIVMLFFQAPLLYSLHSIAYTPSVECQFEGYC